MADEGNELAPRAEIRRLIWRASIVVLLAFWLVQFSSLTAMRYMRMPDEGLTLVWPRLAVTAIGTLISAGVVAVQTTVLGRPFGQRVVATVLAAFVACLFHAGANYLVFYVLRDVDEPFLWWDYIGAILDWMWFYTSLSAIILALSYSLDLRDRERRMAELRAVAHAAQLRALRYQLNPHFLFNTLNSIAALIQQERKETAEAMVENLSDFLRTGLALDPHDDIPLEREIELQSLYLGIEALRFPDRLTVEIEVPDALRDALVPSLIVQPLVENAIKYAVAKSTLPVTLRIAASEVDGRLHLAVSDCGGDAPEPSERGTGVGLANVANRLRARFGEDCEFGAGRGANGGFAAHLAIPLAKAA